MAAADWLTARPIAHRGFHDAGAGRLENTLPAFAAAIDRNFSIETDLHVTTDNRVVAFHDNTLDRLTDATGDIAGKDLATLKAAKFKHSKERIPTFEEILDLVDGRVPLVLEMKDSHRADGRLENAVAFALSTYSGPVVVMSFDPTVLRIMRSVAPAIPRGMLADRFEGEGAPSSPLLRTAFRHLLPAPYVMPQFIAYGIKALPASAPLTLRHFFGLPLLTWTVRTAAERRLAHEWADQIIFEGFDPDHDPLPPEN